MRHKVSEMQSSHPHKNSGNIYNCKQNNREY